MNSTRATTIEIQNKIDFKNTRLRCGFYEEEWKWWQHNFSVSLNIHRKTEKSWEQTPMADMYNKTRWGSISMHHKPTSLAQPWNLCRGAKGQQMTDLKEREPQKSQGHPLQSKQAETTWTKICTSMVIIPGFVIVPKWNHPTFFKRWDG